MAKLIGTAPNQVPTNGDLGSMAFEDRNNYVTKTNPIYQPYRNLIINGDMKIAQRGTSTTGLQYNNDNNYPCCDRWKFQHFGSTSYTAAFTGSQDTDVPSGQGFDYSMKLACTTADATLEADTAVLWSYPFEGQMLQHLAYGTSNAKKMTFSFWVKSNVTGVFNVELYQYDANDAFSYEYTINTADTWEKKTITIPANTSNIITNDNTVGMSVRFNLALGSNYIGGTLPTGWQTRVVADISPSMTNNIGSSTSNYINITGVQLEVGTSASDFEFLPYDVNLQRCQRYYYQHVTIGYSKTVGIGYYYNSSDIRTSIQFPTTMRTNPSLVEGTGTNAFYFERDNGSDYFNGWTALIRQTENTATLYVTGQSGTQGSAGTIYVDNNLGKLGFDAEI